MMYKIADYFLKLPDTPYKNFKRRSFLYKCDNASGKELYLNITSEDIEFEIDKFAEDKNRHKGPVHSRVVNRKFADIVPIYNAFLLHSVCIDIDGVGVAFSAQSGTGKSTHLANWWRYLNGTENMPESLKNLLKDKETASEKDETLPDLTIVNGDKPIVRFFDEEFCKEKDLEIPEGTEFGVPYAYGTPWCGKENLGCNMRTKLKHICFIERSETNFVTKIDKNEAVNRIMKQVYMPKDPVALSKTLGLVDRLINSCELWIIHCNMEPESAKIAYDAIFKNH